MGDKEKGRQGEGEEGKTRRWEDWENVRLGDMEKGRQGEGRC